jgi:hypothetical protein
MGVKLGVRSVKNGKLDLAAQGNKILRKSSKISMSDVSFPSTFFCFAVFLGAS